MKKAYKINVDCANCANKMETAANNTEGVNSAVVNFMTQKLIVDFDDSADKDYVIKELVKKCRKIDSDIEIMV